MNTQTLSLSLRPQFQRLVVSNMGFNSVYRTLQDLFPQVDVRLLKAVAIEHSKDADAAAEVVLSEVIPYMSKKSITSSSSSSAALSSSSGPRPSSASQGAKPSPVGEEEHEEKINLLRQINLLRRTRVKKTESAGPYSEQKLMATEDAIISHFTSDSHHAVSTLPEEALNESLVSKFYDARDGDDQLSDQNESEEQILLGEAQEVSIEVGPVQKSCAVSHALMHGDDATDNHHQVCGNIDYKELIFLGNCKAINVKVGPEQTPHIMSSTSVHEDGHVNSSLNNLHYEWEDFDGPTANDFDNSLAQLVLKSTPLVVENSVAQLVQSTVQEHTPDAPESGLQSEIGSVILITDCEKIEAGDSLDLISKQDYPANETVEINESTLNNIVSQSSQICRIDLLEEIIEDAKNNKKILFSSMESVMNMMREVELKEKAAELAKEEANRGGLDILTKVEELKQMLVHARGANDMHAGEVYGEKAILATELRELQSRLLGLSDERDKSLAILDEMRKTLEARLAAAEEVRRAAEQEKLEKEESTKNALAEQEAIKEKVVQESKILQEEAEANSKLREFLMDRGRVIDMLQGEISVICQDVRLLKEKFDDRVPLSKSVSSSQTTCILASSTSSLKSVASNPVIEQGEALKTLETRSPSPTHSVDGQMPNRSSPASSIAGHSPSSRVEKERSRVDYKALVDDGWDFFDNEPGEKWNS